MAAVLIEAGVAVPVVHDLAVEQRHEKFLERHNARMTRVDKALATARKRR